MVDNQDEEQEIINEGLVNYFEDPDFINLLNIIKNKPNYLHLVNAYLSHGDIVQNNNIEEIQLDDFKFDEHLKLLEEKLKPNLETWDENYVKQLLINYDGNVNLTSRHILL